MKVEQYESVSVASSVDLRITSSDLKNGDTAKSDSFCDFCAFSETRGCTVFLWKGYHLQKRLEPMA